MPAKRSTANSCSKISTRQDDLGSNTLEVHIHNLRRKLGKDRIRTVRGIGYRLEPSS